MKKLMVTWIGTGKTGLHTYIRVQFELDGFVVTKFLEVTEAKAATLVVDTEIEVPLSLLK